MTAVAGAPDVGAVLAEAGVSAIRGAIRAGQEIGGDLGTTAREAVRGAITAAGEIGGDLAYVTRGHASADQEEAAGRLNDPDDPCRGRYAAGRLRAGRVAARTRRAGRLGCAASDLAARLGMAAGGRRAATRPEARPRAWVASETVSTKVLRAVPAMSPRFKFRKIH